MRNKLKHYTDAPMPHSLVMEMLVEYERPNDKISELIKAKTLTKVRRGLYVAGPESDLTQPNLFVVANNLRGPSYISLESALSYWGLIPERVYEVSSVTLKTTKKYTNNLGRFSFQKVASPYYAFGIESVKLSEFQTALIASKEKAICDKIILSSGVQLRSISQAKEFLLDDLRIDENALQSLQVSKIESWIEDAPKKTSLLNLTKAISSL